jgi:hypothetical protein
MRLITHIYVYIYIGYVPYSLTTYSSGIQPGVRVSPGVREYILGGT